MSELTRDDLKDAIEASKAAIESSQKLILAEIKHVNYKIDDVKQDVALFSGRIDKIEDRQKIIGGIAAGIGGVIGIAWQWLKSKSGN
jgi:hypothetical protein